MTHVFRRNHTYLPIGSVNPSVNSGIIFLELTGKMYGYFIQENATTHTENFSVPALEEVFGEQLVILHKYCLIFCISVLSRVSYFIVRHFLVEVSLFCVGQQRSRRRCGYSGSALTSVLLVYP